jgi:hypothetical protein
MARRKTAPSNEYINEHRELLDKQYQLRGEHLCKRAKSMADLEQYLKGMRGGLPWRNRQDWAIEEEAWKRVQSWNEPPERVFCHPDIIQKEPRLVAYYRHMACLSRKAVGQLLKDPKRWEEGAQLNAEDAAQLARLLNKCISRLVTVAERFQVLRIAALANFGAELNGAWRNLVGIRATNVVKRLLVSELLKSGYLEKTVLPEEFQVDSPGDLPDAEEHVWSKLKSVQCNNGCYIRFGSEPDIAILDLEEKYLGAIEIKGGLDPAGAQERYGAALKSFEKVRKENKNAVTILLMGSMTEQVAQQAGNSDLINYHWHLEEIVSGSGKKREEFINIVIHTLGRPPAPSR